MVGAPYNDSNARNGGASYLFVGDCPVPLEPTETPDRRAAISYVLLCSEDEGHPTVDGAGADACPEGDPFVRWEWLGASFVAEDDQAGTTVVATEFKEPNEPVEAGWTSTDHNVSGAVVGAGSETCTYGGDTGALPHGGSVETCPGTGGASSATGLGIPGLDEVTGLFSLVGLVAIAGLVGTGERN